MISTKKLTTNFQRSDFNRLFCGNKSFQYRNFCICIKSWYFTFYTKKVTKIKWSIKKDHTIISSTIRSLRHRISAYITNVFTVVKIRTPAIHLIAPVTFQIVSRLTLGTIWICVPCATWINAKGGVYTVIGLKHISIWAGQAFSICLVVSVA